MAACGTRFQYTQLPNGSFKGKPSARTSVRLAPEPARPRSVTPCVVGLAVRDEDRRNRLKPGVARRTSSRAPAATLTRSAARRTDAAAGATSPGLPREAVTVTASDRPAGASTIRIGVASSRGTTTLAGAKPAACASATASLPAAASKANRPSAPVVASATAVSLTMRRTEASGTGAPEASTTTPVTRRPAVWLSVVPGALTPARVVIARTRGTTLMTSRLRIRCG